MIDTEAHMRVSVELTGLQMIQGSIEANEAANQAVRELLLGGGAIGEPVHAWDRDATRFTYSGPPELVRPVAAALMAFIGSTGD